jgi:hypothetical protein
LPVYERGAAAAPYFRGITKETVMKANIGTVDRVVRVVVGLVIIGAGIYFRSWWGLIGLLPIPPGGPKPA